MPIDTRHYCLTHKIASFSLDITYDGKKQLEKVKWSEITTENFARYHNNHKSGFAILAGANNLFVIDCDITKAAGTFPQDILNTLDGCCKAIVKTPHGKHYYFTGSGTPQTGAYWKGERVEFLDILAGQKIILAPPSHYAKGDVIMRYEWIEGNLATVSELPEEIAAFLQPPQRESSTKTFRETSAEVITRLLDGLSIERVKNYDDWLKIGLALYNENFSVELWDEVSKKAPNYQPGVCADKWKTFDSSKDKKITLGTLYMFLKQDNPKLFEELSKERISTYQLCARPTHASTALLFYTLAPLIYIYSPEMGWFQIEANNHYKLCEKEPIQWKTKVRDTVSPMITEAFIYYQSLVRECDENEKEVYVSYMKNCHAHLKSVENLSYINSVLAWLQEYCLDRSIYNKIDKNRNLLAFDDCVFDFSTCQYRDIQPSDYISLTTGYNAPSLDTPIHPTLEKFLYSLFENKNKTNYLLTVTSYAIWGDNRLQEFYMLQGDQGGNGKGLYIGLVTLVLGKYISTLPAPYLTDPINRKGVPLPELAKTVNSRVVVIPEPDSTVPVREDFIKVATGGDALEVRKLHKDSFTFVPQFTIFIMCNLLKFSKPGGAVKRRLRLIKFPFEFRNTQDFNPNNELSRPADSSMETILKTDEVRDSFMALLLRTFKSEVFGKKELLMPPEVKQETEDFFNSQVPISGWLSEFYHTNGNTAKDRVTATEMANAFAADTGKTIDARLMGIYLTTLGIPSKKTMGKVVYLGVSRRVQIE